MNPPAWTVVFLSWSEPDPPRCAYCDDELLPRRGYVWRNPAGQLVCKGCAVRPVPTGEAT